MPITGMFINSVLIQLPAQLNIPPKACKLVFWEHSAANESPSSCLGWLWRFGRITLLQVYFNVNDVLRRACPFCYSSCDKVFLESEEILIPIQMIPIQMKFCLFFDYFKEDGYSNCLNGQEMFDIINEEGETQILLLQVFLIWFWKFLGFCVLRFWGVIFYFSLKIFCDLQKFLFLDIIFHRHQNFFPILGVLGNFSGNKMFIFESACSQNFLRYA